MNGEIRQNKVTKEWVIFAPTRGKRPHDFQTRVEPTTDRPEHSDRCPFCTGNEHMLLGVTYQTELPGDDPWQTRVVPNRFPVLTPEESIERYNDGFYLAMPGFGHHEVVVESPRHNARLDLMTPRMVQCLFDTYYHRYRELSRDDRNVLILIFKNHGPRAGASLEHPHSQIVTAGVIPRRIRWRNFEAQRHHDELGTCVYCDVLAHETRDRRRIVFESEHFVAFVPYAADVPFEMWVVPRRHHPSFGQTSEAERVDLAVTMHEVLSRLANRLNNPDFNYVIYSNTRYGNAPQLHWYVRIRPRLVTRAGFEIGSGMRINPSLPESDAAFLAS